MAEIDIRKVEKFYGANKVVHGVDLSIRNGEFVVILGPSGCGKSTLLRMIAGLEAISAGEIAIGGDVVNHKEPRERGCAMVFQNYALYPHFSVAENIGYALKVAGVPKPARMAKVREVARTVGLDEYLDRKPGQLSGGQRQRVAMARAMIREPKVFLFDEPLSNLDAKLRVQMRIEIRRLHQRLAATSIFVTHDQIEAMTLADRIVVMNKGAIEQVGTPEEVYAAPASLFVAEFIGSPPMNILKGRITGVGEMEIGAARYGVATPTGLGAGDEVLVGIRPEQIELSSGEAAHAILPVEFVERLGAAQLVHSSFYGAPFVVQLPPEATASPLSSLGVLLPLDKLHFFDAVNGKRLAVEKGSDGDASGRSRNVAMASAA
jgi:sn-glycerol 3-phosphate transport system ATP-binding protein